AKKKSSFLANVSHEIRTPVSAILGLTDMILWDTHRFSSANKSRLELISLSGEHLLAVINGVLDYSKIDDEDVKFQMHEAPLKLRKCVKEAVHLAALSPAAAKKKIIIVDGTKPIGATSKKLSRKSSIAMADLVRAGARDTCLPFMWTVDDSVPDWILGDVTRIRQVILNLLTNALKFTEEGSVTLTISRLNSIEQASAPVPLFEGQHHPTSLLSPSNPQPDPTDKAILLFTVVDTGCGMPPEKLNRLFQPYSQLDNSYNHDTAVGTGLGLAISFRLVQMMGGQIWVESSPGIGSKFSFCVPFPVVVNGSSSPDGSSSSSSATTNRSSSHTLPPPPSPPTTPITTLTTRPSRPRSHTPKTPPLLSSTYPLSILVAEDNPINQQIALSLLKKMGYTADLAINGLEAVQLSATTPYDLFL
ncbi:histidine kinase-like ATPase, partial [Phlyctochytrium arcticum]